MSIPSWTGGQPPKPDLARPRVDERKDNVFFRYLQFRENVGLVIGAAIVATVIMANVLVWLASVLHLG